MKRNRNKTPSQENWEKTIGRTSIRAEMLKKTLKIKVVILKNVNVYAK